MEGSRFSHISWQDLEVLLANYYRQEGFEVEHCGTGGPGARDGGVDLRLRKGSQLSLVQCKQDNAHQVGEAEVQQLVGAMTDEGATGAIVITRGKFSAEAKRVAEEGKVRLVDGVGLRRLLGDRLDDLPTPPKLNAPEPVRTAPILVKDGLPHSRAWRRPHDPPNVMIAKGLLALALAAVTMFMAPSAISRWFPTLAAPVETPAAAAAPAKDAASVTVDVPLPPADFRPATEPSLKK